MLVLAPYQKPRLQDFCAASVFTKVLFTRGYGFDEISFPRISFQKKVSLLDVNMIYFSISLFYSRYQHNH